MLKKSFGTKYKRMVRGEVASLVKPNMTIFSLPYLNFDIERKAKKAICVEKDTDTWARQYKIAPSNCKLHKNMASNLIGSENFDLIWADICGCISAELLACLKNYRLKRNGTFIITLLGAREHPKYKKYVKPDRIEGYTRLLNQHGLYPYKILRYFDTSPMLVFFCTKKKTNELIIKSL